MTTVKRRHDGAVDGARAARVGTDQGLCEVSSVPDATWERTDGCGVALQHKDMWQQWNGDNRLLVDAAALKHGIDRQLSMSWHVLQSLRHRVSCLPTMSATAIGGSLGRCSRGVVGCHTALLGRMMPSQAAGCESLGRRHVDRADAGGLH